MTRDWFDRAVEELEAELARGNITQEQFRKEMRELRRELQDDANDYAERARDDYLGDW